MGYNSRSAKLEMLQQVYTMSILSLSQSKNRCHDKLWKQNCSKLLSSRVLTRIQSRRLCCFTAACTNLSRDEIVETS